MTAEVKMVNMKIDGRDVTVPADWTVIRAAHKNDIDIPHYCYHPDLSIAGNCRICMVSVKGAPRPVVGCATPVAEGMEVTTTAAAEVEARKSVMEFLLINHPLDCPECDQAGECKLQDYSVDHGRDHGRFHEEKVRKSKSTMGPHVKYWGSRCILCTRCVRFTDEVSGTGELGIIYRGDRNEIATFPGRVLDNPLSMNTVDICPVGALVSSDFLFQSRVWNLHSNPSICPGCSLGCNTRVDLDAKDQIKRIVPRRNDAVNKEWMCDSGRLNFGYVHAGRLQKPKLGGADATWKEARRAALELLALNGGANTVALVSAWNTSEAMAAILDLVAVESPAARIFGYGNPVVADQVFPGFTIYGDKNPNRAGMEQVLGIADPAASLKALASETGSIGTLLLVHNIPDFVITPEFKAVLDRSENVVLLDFASGELLRYGNVAVALPTLTSFEKAGTFVNNAGLAQSFEPVMEPATYGLSEAEIVEALKRDVGAATRAGAAA
jgi:NADH-quinone oxidoreductase subunit G